MKTTKSGARVTKAGNVVGMTKAYAVVFYVDSAARIIETNSLEIATKRDRLESGEVHSSGGVMMSFKKEEN